MSRFEEVTQTRWCVNARHASEPQNQKKFWAAVNKCEHPLLVLVLCVFGTCRAFVVPAEVFHTWCPHVHFSRAPVFVSLKALELMSAQFPL